MKAKRLFPLISCFVFAISFNAQAAPPPFLAFTDLISGPDQGLNDGKGSGTIVTVWGQHLGSSQGISSLTFTDSSNQTHTPYIYYWKPADGTQPGGPANLAASHDMVEIAFSIPDSSQGLGNIKVTTPAGESNTLPFTVRSGNIYHVKTNGSDTTGDGSWNNPWATVSRDTNGAFRMASAGSIIYVHDGVTEGGHNVERGIYMSSREATLSTQTGLAAYPGARPVAKATSDGSRKAHAFQFYLSSAVVVSKYTILGGNYNEPAPTDTNILPNSPSGSGIASTANGRVVGNYIAEVEGKCVSGVSGAIVGGAAGGYDAISNFKAYGNHIYDWGCDQSSHFGHTTYMTNRSGTGLIVSGWEMAWNHLENNKSKYGLHNYDQAFNGSCSDVSGEISIHSNYVINQKGAGITFAGTEPDSATDGDPGICWTTDLTAFNNILINVGLGPADENGVSSSAILLQDGGMSGTVKIHNNTIHNWSDEHSTGSDYAFGFAGTSKDIMTLSIFDNIIHTDKDSPFHNFGSGIIANLTGKSNIWHYSGDSPIRLSTPTWDTSALSSPPLHSVIEGKYILNKRSPAKDSATHSTPPERDIYGILRSNADIGAVEHTPSPPVAPILSVE